MRAKQWLQVFGMMAVGALVAGNVQAATLVTQSAAARLGLTRAWYTQAGSIASAGPLIHANFDEGLVLVQSSMGKLTAIDGETGRIRWSTQVGPTRRQSTEPSANADFVVVINGSVLYVVDYHDGGIMWSKALSGSPGAGPCVSKTHAFVPMLNGQIEAYDLEKGPKQTPWVYKSAGRVLVPPMASGTTVSWPTEKGHFYVAGPAADGIRYRLETRDSIHARPAHWSPDLFACSTDGYVYSVNEAKGTINWKYAIGSPLFESPAAIENQLFVATEHSGLYCLDTKTAAVQWVAPHTGQFVAASPTRVYASDSVGRLAVLDRASGGKLGALPLEGIKIKLQNGSTDRIYLVGDNCVVQCLRETSAKTPVRHTPPEPEQPEVEAPAKKPVEELDEVERELMDSSEDESLLDAPEGESMDAEDPAAMDAEEPKEGEEEAADPLE